MVYVKYFVLIVYYLLAKLFVKIFAMRLVQSVSNDYELENGAIKAVVQTPDAKMNGYGYGGIDEQGNMMGGDLDFYMEHVGQPPAIVARKWARRNTAQGLGTWKFGVDETICDIVEKSRTVNEEYNLESYYKVATVKAGTPGYENGEVIGFEKKVQWKVPFFSKYFRGRFGWKFNWCWWSPTPIPAQLVFSIGIKSLKNKIPK